MAKKKKTAKKKAAKKAPRKRAPKASGVSATRAREEPTPRRLPSSLIKSHSAADMETKTKIVARMVMVDGATYAQVAEVTGLNERSVGRRMRAIRQRYAKTETEFDPNYYQSMMLARHDAIYNVLWSTLKEQAEFVPDENGELRQRRPDLVHMTGVGAAKVLSNLNGILKSTGLVHAPPIGEQAPAIDVNINILEVMSIEQKELIAASMSEVLVAVNERKALKSAAVDE